MTIEWQILLQQAYLQGSLRTAALSYIVDLVSEESLVTVKRKIKR